MKKQRLRCCLHDQLDSQLISLGKLNVELYYIPLPGAAFEFVLCILLHQEIGVAVPWLQPIHYSMGRLQKHPNQTDNVRLCQGISDYVRVKIVLQYKSNVLKISIVIVVITKTDNQNNNSNCYCYCYFLSLLSLK